MRWTNHSYVVQTSIYWCTTLKGYKSYSLLVVCAVLDECALMVKIVERFGLCRVELSYAVLVPILSVHLPQCTLRVGEKPQVTIQGAE